VVLFQILLLCDYFNCTLIAVLTHSQMTEDSFNVLLLNTGLHAVAIDNTPPKSVLSVVVVVIIIIIIK